MRNFLRSAALAILLVSTGASALPLFKDRFVDAKTGYIVESQDSGSWMKLSGRHPETGATFRLKVSRAGKVTGLWNGRPVAFVLGAKPSEVELAAASVEASGGAK